ncbi:helix-turn-helix transcriptional regulator [Rhodococcoides kroppenstedtii]|uniref:helix-turn-helix transcriptional regulator n=1 Tax=Rhodococcoides kroppenstedtii TaxID=293050 RepID=UPI00363CDB0F
MAVSKVERLMNLVICLLSTRQFLTAERIRASVAGYEESVSDEAFGRMFERDKNELRDLGVPLETGQLSRFSTTEGYRINRDRYELPEIDLAQDEAAAVAVAVQLWESPELTSAAQSAMLKLRAAGVQVDTEHSPAAVTAIPARSRGSEPALGKLLAAIDAGKSVRFPHRASPTAEAVTRTVEPWAVVTQSGRWYLVGHDVDRRDVRTFRLSRIGDDVVAFGRAGSVRKPDDVDPAALVARLRGTGGVAGTARVWVADGRAEEVRRLGSVTETRTVAGRAGEVVDLSVRSWEWVARVIAGHGADAIVLAPEELRDQVVRILTGVADRDGANAVTDRDGAAVSP